MEHRFGGTVTMFDRATRVRLSSRVFGIFECECDEDTGRSQIMPAILTAFHDLCESSPSAPELFSDPSAFPAKIDPAIQQALSAKGFPPVRIRDWNASLSPDSIDAWKAATPKGASSGAIASGAPVLVQWSDGNRYPGTVRSIADGQFEIAFSDGQVRWIPSAYVSRA